MAAVEGITKDSLTYLELNDNTALASFKNNVFSKLTGLSINGCSLITQEGFLNNTLPEVTVLHATKTDFMKFTTDFGAAQQLPKLNSLLLGGSPITEFNDPDLEMRLTFLDLSETPLTDFSNRTMPGLKHLHLTKSQIISFNNNNFGQLWNLQSSGAQLESLECDKLPALQNVTLGTE